jgi:hypothetical protein
VSSTVVRTTARRSTIVAGLGLGGLLVGVALQRVSGDRMEPWIVGRAAGVAAYLLLVALVLLGLALSHPWRTRVAWPGTGSRIRTHIALALFTLAFTALHVGVLATDRYAGVGWWGAFVPMGASYRPAATTLGVLGVWTGVLAGLTAAAAGHLPRRMWWPLHKIAVLSLIAVWLHGILAGSDSTALRVLYISTGAVVLVVAVSRYATRTPADKRGTSA